MNTNRVIKRPDYFPGLEVVEHTERDSGYLLADEFGRPDFADTEPTIPAELELLEIKPSRLERIKKSWSRR